MNRGSSGRSDSHFPVANIRSRLIRGNFAEKVDAGAPVFLAAVLELVAAKVLHGARRTCIQDSPSGTSTRIVPRHIQQAVHASKELRGLWRSVSPHSAKVLEGCLITIEGNFGAGKKAFLHQFADTVSKQVNVNTVESSADRGLLSAWRQDCSRFALPLYIHCATAAFIQLEHCRTAVRLEKQCGIGRLGIVGVLAGVMQSYAQGQLGEREIAAFMDFYTRRSSAVAKPDLMLYLDSEPYTCHQNLMLRDMDEQLSLAYLHGIGRHNVTDK